MLEEGVMLLVIGWMPAKLSVENDIPGSSGREGYLGLVSSRRGMEKRQVVKKLHHCLGGRRLRPCLEGRFRRRLLLERIQLRLAILQQQGTQQHRRATPESGSKHK